MRIGKQGDGSLHMAENGQGRRFRVVQVGLEGLLEARPMALRERKAAVILINQCQGADQQHDDEGGPHHQVAAATKTKKPHGHMSITIGKFRVKSLLVTFV